MAFRDFRTKADKKDNGYAYSPKTKAATTYINEGCELSGKLRFRETVQIDGQVEGKIKSEDTVIVGEPGRIRATIHANSVIISGTVEGDIVAKRKITLHKTARVTGDIRTSGIVIEEGAKVEGHIVIGSGDASVSKKDSSVSQRSAQPADSARQGRASNKAGDHQAPPQGR